MTQRPTIKLALDTSARMAILAVANEDGLIREFHLPAVGKASSGLANAVLDALLEIEIDHGDVTSCVAGMGPGSFTGIRSGASFIMGFARGVGATCGGISTSYAMATAAPSSATAIEILHDGRRGEVICSPFQRSNSGELLPEEPFACPIASLATRPTAYRLMLEDDPARPQVEEKIGPIATLATVPAAAMLSLPPGPMEPIYVRPAVFVAARPAVNNA